MIPPFYNINKTESFNNSTPLLVCCFAENKRVTSSEKKSKSISRTQKEVTSEQPLVSSEETAEQPLVSSEETGEQPLVRSEETGELPLVSSEETACSEVQ